MVSVVLLNSATIAQSSHGQYINRCGSSIKLIYKNRQWANRAVACQPQVLDHKLAEGKS